VGERKLKDKIYQFMQEYQRKHGEGPRMEDIGDALGTPNRSHIYYYIKQLEGDGLVVPTRPPNFARRFRAVSDEGKGR
jgi:SOS-response transcriptional repressor LexA